MTVVVLLILAVLWAVVLVPPLLRARSERNRHHVGVFARSLDALSVASPASGRLHSVPAGRSAHSARAVRISARTAKRRRDVLAILGFCTLVSLAGAALSGQPAFWALFALSAAALGGYVWALASADRIASHPLVAPVRHPANVRYLPPPRRHEPQPIVLRRSVGS